MANLHHSCRLKTKHMQGDSGLLKAIIYTFPVLSLAFSLSTSVKAQALIDLESGLVFPGYNDVRVPGDQGCEHRAFFAWINI